MRPLAIRNDAIEHSRRRRGPDFVADDVRRRIERRIGIDGLVTSAVASLWRDATSELLTCPP